MRIYIRENNKRRIMIPVPISLARFALRFGNVGIRIAKKYVDKDTAQYLDIVDLKALSRSLKEIKKYRGLKIVEVKTKDGDEVVIKV